MEFVLREMNKFDSVKCKELTVQLGYPEQLIDFDKRFSLINKLPHHHLVVGETLADKNVIAWMHLEIRYLLFSTFRVEISALIVDERFRGNGVGRRLLNYAENWTKNCGFKEVFLYNQSNIEEESNFCLKNGFQYIKDLKMFIKSLDKNHIISDVKMPIDSPKIDINLEQVKN
ncbi:GNAT family N-acetyltransferase [Pigmentibacter sp. JX0631]|uniref:GNAT family N-acetyltransferase n=1 Tax=Pigmentibacter sp. JX0631 TaxID=2976982 RepID=UPI002469B508|nr:GNAT family N-acetyltransferase [Pigmentibacter sp. JX0631]WGL60078.1 GNAT family N-acetyltransferase [Pigmentibacter sp. JX0631]